MCLLRVVSGRREAESEDILREEITREDIPMTINSRRGHAGNPHRAPHSHLLSVRQMVDTWAGYIMRRGDTKCTVKIQSYNTEIAEEQSDVSYILKVPKR